MIERASAGVPELHGRRHDAAHRPQRDRQRLGGDRLVAATGLRRGDPAARAGDPRPRRRRRQLRLRPDLRTAAARRPAASGRVRRRPRRARDDHARRHVDRDPRRGRGARPRRRRPGKALGSGSVRTAHSGWCVAVRAAAAVVDVCVRPASARSVLPAAILPNERFLSRPARVDGTRTPGVDDRAGARSQPPKGQSLGRPRGSWPPSLCQIRVRSRRRTPTNAAPGQGRGWLALWRLTIPDPLRPALDRVARWGSPVRARHAPSGIPLETAGFLLPRYETETSESGRMSTSWLRLPASAAESGGIWP